jgi:hypothetical protein
MICKAVLLVGEYTGHLTENFNVVIRHLHHFEDHKAAFVRFLQYKHLGWIMERYMKHFGAEIEEDRAFLIDAIHRDCFANLYKALPRELRMDVEVLQLAVESVCHTHVDQFLQAVPPEAFFILLRVLDLSTVRLKTYPVPPSFWQNREFIIRWADKSSDIPKASIPPKFCNDRELCLSLYMRCQYEYEKNTKMGEKLDWIPRAFCADKGFVLECLNWHPWIFHSCDQTLQQDFDVFVMAASAAIQADAFLSFLTNLKEPSMLLVNAIPSKLEVHSGFVTYLTCLWKSRQLSLLPLRTLDCDDDTARGLNTRVARYLGFRGTCSGQHLKRVWDEVVTLALNQHCSVQRKFIPLISRQSLVQSVLNAIRCRRPVSLHTYPEELWSNSLFVNWASKRGIFSKSISDEFAVNRKICLEYYKRDWKSREMILPWMSESLKSDKDFVLQCLSFDHCILSYCKKDFLSDFDVLLKVALDAVVKKASIRWLVETAVREGWEEAFVFFAKLLHGKIETYRAIKSFDKQAGARYLAHASAVMPLIGSYLGIDLDASKRHELHLIWSHQFFFCLALGGNVKEIYKSCIYKTWRVSTIYDDSDDD